MLALLCHLERPQLWHVNYFSSCLAGKALRSVRNIAPRRLGGSSVCCGSPARAAAGKQACPGKLGSQASSLTCPSSKTKGNRTVVRTGLPSLGSATPRPTPLQTRSSLPPLLVLPPQCSEPLLRQAGNQQAGNQRRCSGSRHCLCEAHRGSTSCARSHGNELPGLSPRPAAVLKPETLFFAQCDLCSSLTFHRFARLPHPTPVVLELRVASFTVLDYP